MLVIYKCSVSGYILYSKYRENSPFLEIISEIRANIKKNI